MAKAYQSLTIVFMLVFGISAVGQVAYADRGHKRGHFKKKYYGKKHHRHGHRHHHRHKVYRFGHRVARLPMKLPRIVHRKTHYYYHFGTFYRPHRSGYIVVRPPVGIRIASLPYGYRRFHVGPRFYYYANGAFFTWVGSRREYVVIDKPDGADAFLEHGYGEVTTYETPSRQYCHEEAIKQSGYYPGLPDEQGTLYRLYQSYMSSCMGDHR